METGRAKCKKYQFTVEQKQIYLLNCACYLTIVNAINDKEYYSASHRFFFFVHIYFMSQFPIESKVKKDAFGEQCAICRCCFRVLEAFLLIFPTWQAPPVIAR